MPNCIFCKIVKKEIKSEVVYEDEQVFAFRDIKPLAPIHILIIPKKHIASINDLDYNNKKDEELAGKMILTARKISEDLKIFQNGYKLLFRVGLDGGQEVPHIHLHLIGGAPLFEKIGPIND